jgi:hypothetical protein
MIQVVGHIDVHCLMVRIIIDSLLSLPGSASCWSNSLAVNPFRKAVMMGEKKLHPNGDKTVHLPMLQSHRMSILSEENTHARICNS